VGEDEIAEDGGHEGVGSAFGEEFVDPELKAAVESELGGKNFVLGEDQKEEADADAEDGQGAGVLGIGGRHGWMIVKTRCGEKEKVLHRRGTDVGIKERKKASGLETPPYV